VRSGGGQDESGKVVAVGDGGGGEHPPGLKGEYFYCVALVGGAFASLCGNTASAP
jgi:hypothetical protein